MVPGDEEEVEASWTDETGPNPGEPTPQPGTALDVRPPSTLFQTDDPASVIERASEVAKSLADVIEQRNLVSNIKGRRHVQVEGWTLLGSMLGVYPVCTWTKKLEDGWEARVEARTRDGAVVGAAEAECLRSESNWRNREDFALRSMAQTRATSKALRLPLGFVIQMAGYDATPAEEMDHTKAPPMRSGATETGVEAKGGPDPGRFPEMSSLPQQQKLHILAKEKGWSPDKAHQEAGVSSFKELTKAQASDFIEKWAAGGHTGSSLPSSPSAVPPDLNHDLAVALGDAFSGKPRSASAFLKSFLRQAGVTSVQELSTDDLGNLFTALQARADEG